MGMKTQYMKKHFYKNRIRSVLFWTVEIAAVLLLAALFSVFMCKSTVVQEGSMEPTLEAGNEVLINTAAYRFSSPKRGDIIAFRLGDDSSSSIHIKRIICLPGETILIDEGQVVIDGEPYTEENMPAIENPGVAETTLTLGKNEYFVLGDNRNSSEDSRYTTIGMVQKDNIIGKIWFRTGPFSEIGLIRR